MQSLMQACIFCTSNPRGQTTFFAWYVLSGNSLFLGRRFFIFTNNFENALSVTPFSAFHCSKSSVVPRFLWPSSQVGYNNVCDPLTSTPSSPSPFQFHILPLHQ